MREDTRDATREVGAKLLPNAVAKLLAMTTGQPWNPRALPDGNREGRANAYRQGLPSAQAAAEKKQGPAFWPAPAFMRVDEAAPQPHQAKTLLLVARDGVRDQPHPVAIRVGDIDVERVGRRVGIEIREVAVLTRSDRHGLRVPGVQVHLGEVVP